MEEELANDLLVRHWSGRTLPVDPFEIAQRQGLSIAPVFDASGWYKPKEGAIGFNPSEPHVRQRFAVARQLGHHCLSHGERVQAFEAPFASCDPCVEQANRFAMALLMPEGSVRLLVVDRGVTDVSLLARYFNVSEQALGARLKGLGRIG